jgi:cysteine-rich repeat protein
MRRWHVWTAAAAISGSLGAGACHWDVINHDEPTATEGAGGDTSTGSTTTGATGGGGAGGAGGAAGLGDCLPCHTTVRVDLDGVPPNGRRAVGLELPQGTVHGHLSQDPPSSQDCLVCHATTNHQTGTVELLDPDDGQVVSFVNASELSSDPDLSTFCMHCHDADGARRLSRPFDPFGTGLAPTDVATKFSGTLRWLEWYGGSEYFNGEGTWRVVNSHHDISDADQAENGSKLECLSCHSAHGPSDKQSLVDPYSPLAPWSKSENEFCLACHAGGATQADSGMPSSVSRPTVTVDVNGVPCVPDGASCSTVVPALRPLDTCDYQTLPWYVSYRWQTSAHGLGSKRGWLPYYSGAPSYELPCRACHDPHGSATANNPKGNPYAIRDWVDGTSYVDDGSLRGSWLGPAWTTYGTAREVVIKVEEGEPPPPWGKGYSKVDLEPLCGTCHSQIDPFHFHDVGPCLSCHGHGQPADSYDFGWPIYSGCAPCHDTGGMRTSSWTNGRDTSCGDCGNGMLEPFEECDDGNAQSGDGCSNECRVE